MAYVVKQDEALSKREEKQRKDRESRDRYLESLRMSPRFQKWVIQEIFEAKLKEIGEAVFKLDSDNDEAMAKGLRLAQVNKISIEKLISELKP